MDTRIENLFVNSKIVRRVEKCLLTQKRVTNPEKFAYLETVHELKNNGFGLFQIHERFSKPRTFSISPNFYNN